MRILSVVIVSIIVINIAGILISKSRHPSTAAAELSLANAQGLTPGEIATRWAVELNALDPSFNLLVSKNLHPRNIPEAHRLLRVGTTYTVLEFQGERLIAVHKVSG